MLPDSISLGQDHVPDHMLVFPCLFTAGFCALEQAVITLGIEQPFLVEPGFLKAMVHIGGQDEIVLIFHNLIQIIIGGLRRVHVAVDPDVSAPVSPEFFLCFIGIETAGIHVPETVLPAEITEVFVKPLSGIHKPGGCGQAGPGTDDHSVRLIDLFFQQQYLFIHHNHSLPILSFLRHSNHIISKESATVRTFLSVSYLFITG